VFKITFSFDILVELLLSALPEKFKARTIAWRVKKC